MSPVLVVQEFGILANKPLTLSDDGKAELDATKLSMRNVFILVGKRLTEC